MIIMNNGNIHSMQYRQSPTSGFSNFQKSPQHPQLQGWGAPAQGWGTPARGYSPNQRGGRTQGQYISPGPQTFSPRNNSFHTPGSQKFSPRNNSFNNSQYRYQSPNDADKFRTPHSPFSPPGSHSSSRGRGRGRKSFTNQFGQTPRWDRNCNPGGSGKIEDYYHPSMLDDPWKNCSPVTHTSMAAT